MAIFLTTLVLDLCLGGLLETDRIIGIEQIKFFRKPLFFLSFIVS